MKLLAILVVLSLTTVFFAQGQSPAVKPLTKAEKKVLQTGRDLFQARIQGDTKALTRLLANNHVSPFGDSKQVVLKKARPYSDFSFDASDLKVRIFGDSAEVTGRIQRQNAGTDANTYEQWVERLIKGKMGWQSISNQRVPMWQDKPLTDAELTVLTPLNCNQREQLQSLNSEQQTHLKIKNTMAQSVILRWINYEGLLDPSEHLINTIQPQQSIVITTYVTHPFLVTDANGKCLGIYQPTLKPALAIIK